MEKNRTEGVRPRMGSDPFARNFENEAERSDPVRGQTPLVMILPSYWQQAKIYLSKTDPVMGKIISHYEGETLTSIHHPFHTLCRSIIGQQISTKAADSIWQRFEALLGRICPHALKEQSDEALAGIGLSRQKIRYLHAIADYFIGHNLDQKQDHLFLLEDSNLEEQLLAIKGIGVWTVQMFQIFHRLHPDIFPISDLGLLKAIEGLYDGQDKKDREAILALSETWKPYRTVATWYLWRSIDPDPVAY